MDIVTWTRPAPRMSSSEWAPLAITCDGGQTDAAWKLDRTSVRTNNRFGTQDRIQIQKRKLKPP